MQDQAATNKPKKGKYLSKSGSRRKKRVLGIVAAAAAVGLLLWVFLPGRQQEQPLLDLADTTVLAYTDLQSTISASGTVESADSTTVYSVVSYPVMAVHVEVGDQVTEGQLLAELDGASIENQITSQQITLDVSTQSSAQQVETARDNYDNYKSGLDQGLNSSLNNAQIQADNAYDAYVKALTVYERYAESLDVGENTTLINAQAALQNAEDALMSASSSYDQLMEHYWEAYDAYETLQFQWEEANAALDATKQAQDSIGQQIDAAAAELAALGSLAETDRTPEQISRMEALEAQLSQLDCQQTQLAADRVEQELTVLMLTSSYEDAQTALVQLDAQTDSAQSALQKAELAYDTQVSSYNATLTTVDNTLADYRTNVDTTWKAYQNALTAVASTEKSTQDQLETYENALASAQIGANKAASEEGLRQLEESLEDTRITAPCSGTVTAVYAQVGRSGSGLLFVIEDVDNLVVNTSVKGYDVGTVQTGTKVLIRSDSTGSKIMNGVLTTIAPTSNKNAAGQTDVTGESVFAAEVEITDRDTGLRIGMEAQLDYVVAEESHVLAVPYDAVYENDRGQTCILAAEEQEDGRYRIYSVPVQTGMDDDLDMAVSGAGLTEGMLVINDAESYLHLLDQTVTAGTGLHADLMSAMMGG